MSDCSGNCAAIKASVIACISVPYEENCGTKVTRGRSKIETKEEPCEALLAAVDWISHTAHFAKSAKILRYSCSLFHGSRARFRAQVGSSDTVMAQNTPAAICLIFPLNRQR